MSISYGFHILNAQDVLKGRIFTQKWNEFPLNAVCHLLIWDLLPLLLPIYFHLLLLLPCAPSWPVPSQWLWQAVLEPVKDCIAPILVIWSFSKLVFTWNMNNLLSITWQRPQSNISPPRWIGKMKSKRKLQTLAFTYPLPSHSADQPMDPTSGSPQPPRQIQSPRPEGLVLFLWEAHVFLLGSKLQVVTSPLPS